MKTIILCCLNLTENSFNIIERLLSFFSDKLLYAIPHMTRKPKQDEISGINGYFITEEAFKIMIQRGYFLEYSQSSSTSSSSSTQSYSFGTSLEVVETIHELNRICLMIVNCAGAKVLKSKHFPAKYVLLPSPKVETTETTSGEDQQSSVPIVEDQKIDQYDLEINDETTVFEELKTQFVHWFPELAS